MNGAEKIPKETLSARLFIFLHFSYTVLIDLLRDRKALRVDNVGSLLKQAIVEEKKNSGNEVEKVH